MGAQPARTLPEAAPQHGSAAWPPPACRPDEARQASGPAPQQTLGPCAQTPSPRERGPRRRGGASSPIPKKKHVSPSALDDRAPGANNGSPPGGRHAERGDGSRAWATEAMDLPRPVSRLGDGHTDPATLVPARACGRRGRGRACKRARGSGRSWRARTNPPPEFSPPQGHAPSQTPPGCARRRRTAPPPR